MLGSCCSSQRTADFSFEFFFLKNNGNGRKGLWMVLLSIYALTHAINSDTSHMSTGLNIGLQCFRHVWSCLTCWHWNTTLHSYSKFELMGNKFHQVASDSATHSSRLAAVVIFIPTAAQKQTPPSSFLYPHPSFFTPSNFSFHSPPPCTLSQILRIHPPYRLPLSTAAAKNKTGWCGGPMGEAQRWWNSASLAWALTPLNSATWLCLFNIQSAVGSGVSHSL